MQRLFLIGGGLEGKTFYFKINQLHLDLALDFNLDLNLTTNYRLSIRKLLTFIK